MLLLQHLAVSFVKTCEKSTKIGEISIWSQILNINQFAVS